MKKGGEVAKSKIQVTSGRLQVAGYKMQVARRMIRTKLNLSSCVYAAVAGKR